MFPSIKPDQTQAWKNLQTHYEQAKTWQLKELFKNNPGRFDDFSIRQGDILVDYSKNIITEKTLKLLLALSSGANRVPTASTHFTSLSTRVL